VNRAHHCTSEVAQVAAGSIAAQEAIRKARICDGNAPHAWHEFAILMATYGPRSPAAAAFVAELCKRAAAA